MGDGGVRDLDEMTSIGLHVLSRTHCVGHAHGGLALRWDLPVEVFGCVVKPGQLIHADKHGFMAIPPEDEQKLLEASEFCDALERRYLIKAGLEGHLGSKNGYQDVADGFSREVEPFLKERVAKFGSKL